MLRSPMDELLAAVSRSDATIAISVATVIGYIIGRFCPGEGCLLIMIPLVMIDIVAVASVVDPNFATAFFRSVTGAWLAYFAGRGFRAQAMRSARRANQGPPRAQPSPP